MSPACGEALSPMRAFSVLAHDRLDSKVGTWSSNMSSCSSTLQSAKSSSILGPPAVDDGDDKVLMTVEVCLKETSSAPYPVRTATRILFQLDAWIYAALLAQKIPQFVSRMLHCCYTAGLA